MNESLRTGGLRPRGIRARFLRHLARIVRAAEGSIADRQMRAVMEARGASHALRVPTWTTPRELAALYQVASRVPRGSLAVEIGSYLGASTCFLAAGLAEVEGRLICVDTWQNESMPEGPRDTFDTFVANTRPFESMITPLRKRGGELGPDDFPQPVSLGFIDGDHAYARVREDVESLLPHMPPHGVLCFHDFGHENHPGVSRLVGDLLATGDWRIFRTVETLACLCRTNPASGGVTVLGSPEGT